MWLLFFAQGFFVDIITSFAVSRRERRKWCAAQGKAKVRFSSLRLFSLFCTIFARIDVESREAERGMSAAGVEQDARRCESLRCPFESPR